MLKLEAISIGGRRRPSVAQRAASRPQRLVPTKPAVRVTLVALGLGAPAGAVLLQRRARVQPRSRVKRVALGIQLRPLLVPSLLVGAAALGIGYLLPTLFQFGFGSVLVLSRGVDPNHPELILTAIAGGGAAAALALLALTVDETDEAFANVYSAAVSTQNLFPRIPQRTLIVGASIVATGGALAPGLLRSAMRGFIRARDTVAGVVIRDGRPVQWRFE